jgi:hypothetical protein
MKKVLFVLALGAFAACGSGETKTESADTTTVAPADTTTVTPAPADTTTVAPADTTKADTTKH